MLALHFLVLYFSLIDNYIGDAGAVAMAASLEKNSTLTSLNIVNAIGAAGAIAMAAALEKNSTLTDMNLYCESRY